MAPIVRLDGDLAVLTPMRWSFPPMKPGTGPVFNFRSEGRRFSAAQRCLIPATAFFEFTAPADPKAKRKDRWRFERADGDWMGIAGLWKPGEGNHPPVFTMLTCEPGPDVAAIHKRQIVVLEPQDWRAWLTAERAEGEVLRPSAAGTFAVVNDIGKMTDEGFPRLF
jgi:putative SOS response-associated peptidase YedK